MHYIINDLKRMWGRIAANEHWYVQKWLDVPLWQLPEDLLRLQEICYEVQPDWIIETGTKFGGSAIFFASLLNLMGKNEAGVITIDITATEEAKQTLEHHRLCHYVKRAIVGDAASDAVVKEVRAMLDAVPGTVLVFLDDNHNASHVSQEIGLYAPLVTPGSYLIVADTLFQDLADSPMGASTEKYPDVATSNPRVAVQQFLANNDTFKQDRRFMERGVGNFPDGFLKKKELLVNTRG